MAAQCRKSCQGMVLSGLKIFLNLIFNMLYNGLPFLLTRTKIQKREKLFANLHDKSEYIIHIRLLNKPLNKRILLRKADRVIKFNKTA